MIQAFIVFLLSSLRSNFKPLAVIVIHVYRSPLGPPASGHTWVMLCSMLTSPKLWAPRAKTVMTPPALLLITAGETTMEAVGGCYS